MTVISVKYASIFAIAAFAAGSFFAPPVQQAIAAVIATDVQCTGCVGTGDLAGNSVTGTKIAASTITSADVSTGFVKVVNLVDTNCGCTNQWDPNGTQQNIVVKDSKVTPKSVISLTMTKGYAMVCTANLPQTGDFVVSCTANIPDGFGLSYAVINK